MWQNFVCWYMQGMSAGDLMFWVIVRVHSKKHAIRLYAARLKKEGHEEDAAERAIWSNPANWKRAVAKSGVYVHTKQYMSDDEFMTRAFKALT